ncbi:hypothetical protein QZN29_02815 [Burkholderia multivorans]|uniref:Uncharacterized protein n=1 Tax=Burkholderia multivorans TaxID=87883 RepID=A0A8E2RSJ1_9BURK|nr:hypothetical protein [Burkholderia multivorans]MDN8088719.1 hypothetical protein [Burkholderia multivorans]MDN8094697.1 hypothetical protein [Burkholderia multivorans]MDN8109450.1 hypothetical protein [Burkholderia multivorans]MDN8126182.1 hypothetical protein [Burkholderia multivorans]MDN8130713.1 hypothetical protein [Burkholderia multivorans]
MPNDNVLTEQIRAVCNAHIVTMGDDFELGADRLAKRILALLAAHPGQPEPHEDATARIERLRKALFEARDAMRVMANWVKKSDPAGHSWAVHMVDRANTALNGEPEPSGEVTDEQPSLTNPLTPYGMLVRVHALVELHAALAQRQGEGS